MSEKYVPRGDGGLVVSALGIAFIVLKLTGEIDWSWWWVTAPFWIPFALAVLILVAVCVAILIRAGYRDLKRWRSQP